PQGQTLVPGIYTGAERTPFRAPGKPGIDIFGAGRGCNTITGSFTVFEATFSGSTPQPLSATFEQHCEGGTAALFGSVSYAATGPFRALSLSSRSLTFPTTTVGAASASQQFTVTNTGADPLEVTRTAASGNTGDYELTGDTCTGTPIAAGGTCAIAFRFVPTVTGSRTITFALLYDTGKGSQTLSATGVGSAAGPTRTGIFYDSQPGDYIGQGQMNTWTSANASIS